MSPPSEGTSAHRARDPAKRYRSKGSFGGLPPKVSNHAPMGAPEASSPLPATVFGLPRRGYGTQGIIPFSRLEWEAVDRSKTGVPTTLAGACGDAMTGRRELI